MTDPTMCPVCGSAAEKLGAVRDFGGLVIRCKTHSELEATESALAGIHTREQWERAFKVARSRAVATGGRPRIFAEDFD